MVGEPAPTVSYPQSCDRLYCRLGGAAGIHHRFTQNKHRRNPTSESSLTLSNAIDLSENTQYAYVTGFQSYNRQFQLEPISTLK